MGGPLAGKTALVTGSSRGIGRAVALRFGRDGARVLVHCHRKREEADEVASAIRAKGGEAHVVQADMGTMADVQRLFQEVDTWLGADGRTLDILVSNAAIHGVTGQLGAVTQEQFDSVIAVNLRGSFFAAQAAAERMKEGGRIIFVGAVAAIHGYAFDPVYAATKGALNSLAPALAKHLGPRGITVNTVMPGVTMTDMLAPHVDVEGVIDSMVADTALARVGQPDDVAAVVAMLAGEDGRWITGQAIQATGGLWI